MAGPLLGTPLMFTLVSDVDAGEFRRMQRENMPHTCVLWNKTVVNGPGGRPTTARTTPRAYRGPCRLTALGEAEKERILAGAIDASSYYRLIVPAGTPVALTQEVDVSGLDRTDDGPVAFALTLSVIGIDPPHIATQITQKMLCKAVA